MRKGTTTQDPTAAPSRWFWHAGRRLATGERSTASSTEQGSKHSSPASSYSPEATGRASGRPWERRGGRRRLAHARLRPHASARVRSTTHLLRTAACAPVETAAPPRNRHSPAGGSTPGSLLPRTNLDTPPHRLLRQGWIDRRTVAPAGCSERRSCVCLACLPRKRGETSRDAAGRCIARQSSLRMRRGADRRVGRSHRSLGGARSSSAAPPPLLG